MPAWATLEQALVARRPVALRYHGHDRVVCPHALGWKAGRARVLSYQVEKTTGTGTLNDHPNQRWRCLFVDVVRLLPSTLRKRRLVQAHRRMPPAAIDAWLQPYPYRQKLGQGRLGRSR